MVIETSKTTSLFLLQHGFVLVSNSIHWYNILQPARARFLRIASVRECLYVYVFACVCVCESAPEAINN